MPKGISNRGIRGLEIQDQPLKFKGSAWVEPSGAAFLFDDFIGDTLSADNFLVTDTVAAGAGNVAFAIDATAGDPVAGHGGWAGMTCSNNAGGAGEVAGLAVWRPSRAGNGILVFQTRISHAASVAAENSCVGLTALRTYGDSLAANMTGADTFVTAMANGVVSLFDTRGTADVYFGLSTDANVDSAATEAAAVNLVAPLATTSYVLRIEVDAVGNGYHYMGAADQPSEAKFYGMSTAAGTTLKATLLAPYLGIDNAGAGANKTLESDYIFVGSAR